RGVSGFVQSERSVLAQFADGSTAEGELLVGADGLRSTVRQQCLPELMPSYVGYVAWRALVAEAAFPPAFHGELFNVMTFCLPPGRQGLGYPGAGPRKGFRRGAAPLQGGVAPPGGWAGRPKAPAPRRAGNAPRHIDPAAADPARGDCADARGRRAAARAAIPRGRAHDRRADPA